MIAIIVAISENYAIGKQGDLLCHLPNDLLHFKQITSGKTVLMGERTFFSLPKYPLPNRRNIVLTDVSGKMFDGAESVYSIEESVALLSDNKEEAFVIGGGSVYRQMMPFADKLYITHIHHSWEDADTFFPEIKESEWQLTSSEFHAKDEKNPYDYTFAEYIRKK